MNPQAKNQILIGVVAGIIITGGSYFAMGGKREEAEGLDTQIENLKKEVDKGRQIKINYEKLKDESVRIEKRVEELVKIMPSEQDRSEMPYKIKKMADTAGIDQVSFKLEAPQTKPFYVEYPVRFEFRGGYHTFGQFASQVSGNDKIISISDIVLNRESALKSSYTCTVICKISAYVYKPPAEESSESKPANKPF